jgi:hypothetical protein
MAFEFEEEGAVDALRVEVKRLNAAGGWERG